MYVEERRLNIVVDEALDGLDIKSVLRTRMGMSRRAVSGAKYRWNGITLDGQHVHTNAIVHTGQTLSIVIGDREETLDTCSVLPEQPPEDFENWVVYQDDDVLVVNKPAGLIMYPNKGHESGTLGNYVVHYLQSHGAACVLHPVQRLDKGTSGLVLFTTNAHAQNILTKALHTGDFVRRYTAFCEGSFGAETEGIVDAPMDKLSSNPNVFGITPAGCGKRAVTHYQVEGTSEVCGMSVSRLTLQLETGRTHQIRIHMQYIGHPLLGDETYGGAQVEGLARPALHSSYVRFKQPITGEWIEVTAPLPDDLARLG